MSIDSITLLAQNAYTKINNQPLDLDNEPTKQAADFHKMVEVNFNRFAQMSPTEISQYINAAKAASISSDLSGNSLAQSAIGTLRNKVGKQEEVVRKSLVDEASLTDIVTAANDAKMTVQTMTTLREKFFEAFDKIMNMSI